MLLPQEDVQLQRQYQLSYPNLTRFMTEQHASFGTHETVAGIFSYPTCLPPAPAKIETPHEARPPHSSPSPLSLLVQVACLLTLATPAPARPAPVPACARAVHPSADLRSPPRPRPQCVTVNYLGE